MALVVASEDGGAAAAILACALAPKMLKLEAGIATPLSGRERSEAALARLEAEHASFRGDMSVLKAGGLKVDSAVWDDVAVGVWGSFENLPYLRGKVAPEEETGVSFEPNEAELIARLFRKFGEAATLTKIWGKFSFVACDLKADRVFAARSITSPVELHEGRLDDDVILVVSSAAKHLLAGGEDIHEIPVGHYVSGHRRASVPIQFKHTDQQLEVAVTASRDAVSRALANMPALLTAGPKSRPSTPEIAPASTGAWSSRARRPAPTSSVTSTSGPIYAEAKSAESAATWRRSSFDNVPRRTSIDGPRRGSVDAHRRGSLDLPPSSTAWVPASRGFHEEMPSADAAGPSGGGANGGAGSHQKSPASSNPAMMRMDEGNEGEALRGAAADSQGAAAPTPPAASPAARSIVSGVKNWVFGAFAGKKASEPNGEERDPRTSTSLDAVDAGAASSDAT